MGKLKEILLPADTSKLFRVKPGQLAKAFFPKFGLVDFSTMGVERAEQLISKGFGGLQRKPAPKPVAPKTERKAGKNKPSPEA